MRQIFLLFFLAFTLASCSSGGNNEGVARPEIKGKIEPVVQAIVNHKNADYCEREHGPKMLEVARDLDAHRTEIEAAAKQGTDSGWESFPLGPTYARRAKDRKPAPKKGWLEERDSWSDIYDYYKKNVRGFPVDRYWVALNSRVRGRLWDDEVRVNLYANLSFGHDDTERLARAKQVVQACHTDSQCTRPELDEELKTFFNRVPIYSSLYRGLHPASREGEWLTRLLDWITFDYSKREFIRERSVTRVSANEIRVDLDPGDFASAKEQIAAWIEEKWKSPKLRVKIRWVSRATSPSAYILKLGHSAGEREYVDRNAREMVVFPGVRDTTFAHEFGHILGFRDHYYTIWEPSICSYRIQFAEDDVMSDSWLGEVTEAEWAELDRQYP